jgi:ribonuclease Z
MLRVTFLGTASSRPTVARNVSSLAVQREGRLFLFDCGEGTQRQMMRFGTGFAVEEIFLTHLHADHYLGVTGLLRTMSLQGREEPLIIWSPPGGHSFVQQLITLGGERLTFTVNVRELPPGEAILFGSFRIRAFKTNHTRDSVGLVLAEEDRPGRFDVDMARRLGVPEGPLFGRLHAGETIRLDDGSTVSPDQVVGEPRSGRKLVYSGDTLPDRSTVEVARSADVLIHEATFAQQEQQRAEETGHSTAREAAEVAVQAGVQRLILTHLSARYADQPGVLLQEATKVFAHCVVAKDGYQIEIPYADSGDLAADSNNAAAPAEA